MILFLPAVRGESPFKKDDATSLCGPIPAVCNPTTIAGGLGIGIFFVSLNQINNYSNSPPLLEDFTCSDSTWLVPGVAYPFEVHTGTVYEETLKAWIDFSNDGDFDSTELVYQDSALVYLHYGFITVPLNAVHTFTPIRMRIGSDYSGNFLNGCNDAYYGQYEDYTIYYGAGIGINTTVQNSPLAITPNPFHTTAHLEIGNEKSETGSFQLKIFNSLGALVRVEKIENVNTYVLHREALPVGLYYYSVLTNSQNRLAAGRFIIE